MTYDEFKQVIERVQYRPGHQFLVRLEVLGSAPLWAGAVSTSGAFAVVRLEAEVPCAERRDGSVVTINTRTRIHVRSFELWNTEGVLKWLHQAVILKFEEHEAGEWFRYGDCRPFDPHASEKLAMDIPQPYASLSSRELEEAAKGVLGPLAYGPAKYLLEKLVLKMGDL